MPIEFTSRRAAVLPLVRRWFQSLVLGVGAVASSCLGQNLELALPGEPPAVRMHEPPSLIPDDPFLTNKLVATPAAPDVAPSLARKLAQLEAKLEHGRELRRQRHPHEAEPVLVDLLGDASPDTLKQQALLELAGAAADQQELPRAQQIYGQFLSRWPNAIQIPEVQLCQGRLFREMGMNNLALAKFYSVMTSALVLKNDKVDYYQRLVLLAQTEIAETHYQLGQYNEAADFLARLLKQNSPALNRAPVQFRLVRSLSALGRYDDTVTQAQDFLAHYPEAVEQPEVRFHLVLALKQMGRNNEALEQVLTLLQEEKERTRDHPELWAYWQQRAGNEIGNQLYREGDYTRALGIYLSLAQLDPQPVWQLPARYQIGLTYERLAQPAKALESYRQVLQYEPELGTNAPPGLKAVFEMAKWRAGFVQWQTQAEGRNSAVRPSAPPTTSQPPKTTPETLAGK